MERTHEQWSALINNSMIAYHDILVENAYWESYADDAWKRLGIDPSEIETDYGPSLPKPAGVEEEREATDDGDVGTPSYRRAVYGES
jgi:hypothetical protein